MGAALGLLSVAAAGLSAFSGVQNAKAGVKNAEQQANALNAQAKFQNDRAYAAAQRGEQEVMKRTKRLAQVHGSNAVSEAGSGLLVHGGKTSADVYNANVDEARLDVGNINDAVKQEMDAYDYNAATLRTQAKTLVANAKAQKKAAMWNGAIGVGASLAGWGMSGWGSSKLTEGLGLMDSGKYLEAAETLRDASFINKWGSTIAGINGGWAKSLYDDEINIAEQDYRARNLLGKDLRGRWTTPLYETLF